MVGLRVLAIRAVGHWGTERDRAWLVERARRVLPSRGDRKAASPGGDPQWEALETREARRALFRRAPRPEDSEWLLDLWFAEPGWGIRPAWLCMVPEAALRGRVAAEIGRRDPERLQRAVWLLALTPAVGNRAEILGHLAAGADKAVAKLARERIARLEASDPASHRRLRSPQPRRRRPPP